MKILFYGEKEGPYTAFSNFSNHTIELDGHIWKTVEHYFQAQKFIGTPYYDLIRNLETPKEAAYEGRKYPLPDNWKEIRYDVMKKAVRAKLFQHPDVTRLLLSTSDKELIEDNRKDEVWANGKNHEGQNLFGKVLMDLRGEFKKIAILESEESIKNVKVEDLIDRLKLIIELRKLPVDAFGKLRHLQPQIGCFNRCSFCSQSAGSTIWFLNERGLKNLFSALKTVGLEKAHQYVLPNGDKYIASEAVLNENQTLNFEFKLPPSGLLGYGRTSHRAGVIFCYLDNDISCYPHFDKYIQYAYEDLGVKVRISTVGYSMKNETLQAMHHTINKQHLNKIAGVRLSLTSYTSGWINESDSFGTSKKDFEEDVANFLKVYKPTIDYIGPGQRTGCVEFRFKPLIETKIPFNELWSTEEHIINIGPYLLYRKEPVPLETCKVKVDHKTRKMSIEGQGADYQLFISDEFRNFSEINLLDEVNKMLLDEKVTKYNVKLYKMVNEDGHYYVIEPLMNNDGVFTKQFYPITEKRKFAGYIDSERYFLNNLLKYKQNRGIRGRQDPFPNSTWEDVSNTLLLIQEEVHRLENCNLKASNYIKTEILPLVKMYVKALQKAKYEPSYFYLSTFTIDTGSICNLGQAFYEFRDIASRPNLPLTPQHEKAYGTNSSLSIEGEKWRISVAPHSDKQMHSKTFGKRNSLNASQCIVIERENLALRSLGSVEGMTDYRQTVEISNIEQMSLKEGINNKMLIGQI